MHIYIHTYKSYDKLQLTATFRSPDGISAVIRDLIHIVHTYMFHIYIYTLSIENLFTCTPAAVVRARVLDRGFSCTCINILVVGINATAEEAMTLGIYTKKFEKHFEHNFHVTMLSLSTQNVRLLFSVLLHTYINLYKYVSCLLLFSSIIYLSFLAVSALDIKYFQRILKIFLLGFYIPFGVELITKYTYVCLYTICQGMYRQKLKNIPNFSNSVGVLSCGWVRNKHLKEEYLREICRSSIVFF